MVKRRREDGRRVGRQRLLEALDQLVKRLAVESELGAAPGVGRCWVGHGVELCARVVEAVHGHEGGYGRLGGEVGGVAGIEGCCEAFGEGCFA